MTSEIFTDGHNTEEDGKHYPDQAEKLAVRYKDALAKFAGKKVNPKAWKTFYHELLHIRGNLGGMCLWIPGPIGKTTCETGKKIRTHIDPDFSLGTYLDRELNPTDRDFNRSVVDGAQSLPDTQAIDKVISYYGEKKLSMHALNGLIDALIILGEQIRVGVNRNIYIH